MTRRPNEPFPCCRTAVVLIIIMLLGACGKKAPPVPPRAAPLPVVSDLKIAIEDKSVVLRWRTDKTADGVEGYTVYRATTDLSAGECPGCPVIFQKIDRVMDKGADAALMFSEPVPPGFRYTYKVRPFYSSGGEGPDSNMAVVEVPK